LEGVIVIRIVARLLRWTSRRLGLHNLLALGLMVVVEVSVAAGIAGAVNGLDAFLLVAVAIVGMLAGWVLASTSLSRWKAGILLFLLGFVGLFLRVGRLGDDLVALTWESIILAVEVIPWVLVLVILQRPPQSFAVDWVPVASALSNLWSGISTLVVRVSDWLQAVLAGNSAFDPVAATLVWGMALWLVSAWAGWTLCRRATPLLATAPGGVLLMATLSYNWGDTLVVLVLLGAMLLLLALTAYSARQRRWLAIGIDFPDLGNDTAVAVILVSSLLVIFAALSPSITFQNLVDFVERFAPGQTGGGELDDEAPIIVVPPSMMEKSHFGDLQWGGLPRRHLIGSGPELSREMVMSIGTGELPPHLPEGIMGEMPRYYWRSITYDVYIGRGWRASEPQTVDYEADEELEVAAFETQRELRQNVMIFGDVEGLLHAAGTLLSVDHDYTVAWRSPEDIFGATLESTTYQAVSLVSTASEEQLRSAGNDYPQWVRDRYLALPKTVPDRVLRLARDLTATEPTPYDRALAIESYLRDYPYTLDLPLPPAGVTDIADYFLFELQEGYCDYYATSMVVLARAAGLPARLAIGYASGSYDPYEAVYDVTAADAHAWVEVYFPGYGWIDFEPTGGRPLIRRSAGDDEVESPDLEETPESSPGGWEELGRFVRLIWWVLPVSPIVAAGVWLAFDNWRWRNLEPPAAVVALYGRLRHHGWRLAVPMRTGDTPYEFAESFAAWSAGPAQEGWWGGLLAGTIAEVRRLVDLYVQAVYTARRVGAVERWHALRAWKRLRWRLWFARLFQRRASTAKKSRRE
jgi:transglutaminase-like putative cysteine protease